MNKKVNYAFKLDEDVLNHIKGLAKQEGRTVSDMFRRLLDEALVDNPIDFN